MLASPNTDDMQTVVLHLEQDKGNGRKVWFEVTFDVPKSMIDVQQLFFPTFRLIAINGKQVNSAPGPVPQQPAKPKISEQELGEIETQIEGAKSLSDLLKPPPHLQQQ